MYMDGIKLFVINYKELDTLIKTIIYCEDMEMEFGLEKCVKLIMRSKKREIIEGIELPNQERIRMLGEKETYK